MLANLFFSSGNVLYLKDLLSYADNGNNVTRSCAEKRHTDGRGVGDLSVLGVGLVGADDVIGKLVQMCRKTVSKERLKGFMMAPWQLNMDDKETYQKVLRGIDLMEEAMKQ